MKINNEHRAATARAWREARLRGEDQASFCARQFPLVRPRTLRQWSKAFPSSEARGSDLQLVYAALANLRVIADELARARILAARPGLDVAGGGRDRAGDGDHHRDGDLHIDAVRAARPVPVPPRRSTPSFSWDDP